MRILFFLSTLSACTDFDVEATINPMVSTVIDLKWNTSETGNSFVEYGFDRDYGMTTRIYEEGTEHYASLYGLTTMTEVFWRAVTEIDGVELEATGKLSTEGVPSSMPSMDIKNATPEKISSEEYLAGGIFSGESCLFGIDRKGNYLWYYLEEDETHPTEVELEDGTNNLLYNTFLTDHTQDQGYIHRLSWNGEVKDDIRTELAHHSFTQLPDGSLAFISIDLRDWYDEEVGQEVPVVGDSIQIITPEGEQYEIFSTWDWAEPEKHDAWDGGFYPQGGDWTHANALSYSIERDTLLLSFRNLNLFLELNWQNGEVLEQYGGNDPDAWQIADGSHVFSYQHATRWTKNGDLIMISTQDETIAVRYELDYDKKELVEVWSHGVGLGFNVYAQGMVQELENGNILVNFGTTGVLHEVTQEQELVWELVVGAGNAFGSTVAFSNFYGN